MEVLGHVMFSFTRSVTDHYNPEEPEYTSESFGYSPLESTGLEWYYHTVDELIYQAPVAQRLDSAIHRINRYPVDKC